MASVFWRWIERAASIYQLWPAVTLAIAAVVAAVSGIVASLVDFVWWQVLVVEVVAFGFVVGGSVILLKAAHPAQVALAPAQDVSLELEIGRTIFHSGSEVDDEGNWIENPIIADLEVTFRISRPMQLFGVYLEVEDEKIEPLGEPTYPASITLLRTLEGSETHRIRFQLPRRFSSRDINVTVVALAGGQTWRSSTFPHYGLRRR